MVIQKFTEEELQIANKFLSPDAFMYVVCDAIAAGKPLSVVGFGDGERSVMVYSKGEKKASYLSDTKYLTEYGLLNADLPTIGQSLFSAAKEADWFCPLISGVYLKAYDCIRICEPRDKYVERLYPYSWIYMGREKELLKHSSIAVVCRNAIKVAENLQVKYQTSAIQPIEYNSWEDYDQALRSIAASGANLILCSVGQSGKYMIVEAAKKGTVVLDVGSALINKWQY